MPGMLITPAYVAAPSCHALSPGFNQSGYGFIRASPLSRRATNSLSRGQYYLGEFPPDDATLNLNDVRESRCGPQQLETNLTGLPQQRRRYLYSGTHILSRLA